MRKASILILLLFVKSLCAQPDDRTPIQVARAIGDKLINETPFKYKLTLPPLNKTFDDLHVIDFGRTFQLGKNAVAYAFTTLFTNNATDFTLQLEHNDGCKIWLNNTLIYERIGNNTINLQYEERSIEMNNQVVLHLKKGVNHLMIKSETKGEQWKVYLQPPSEKGAIIADKKSYPEIGLSHLADIDSSLAKMSKWLVIGPFENPFSGSTRNGLDVEYAPERGISFGKMYKGLSGLITWSIPKVEVLGDVIDSKEWGTNYNWNYHNGGVAWAMESLTELCNDNRYLSYADAFCNFHLQGSPFVNYQVNTLNAFNSANSLFVNTPLLDFTLAPSLPFIYRLLKDTSQFLNRAEYEKFVDSMISYAAKRQLRLPGSNIFTRTTPVEYTTWVDDMFMGIPFLVQASLHAKDAATSKHFINDAADQVLNFNKQVFDESANLYVHAKYSNSDVKLPHWSRANGWGIWATTEVLMNLPKSDKRYVLILDYFKRHVKALVSLQDQSGFWLNVLDRKDAQKEVSGTAIFTMAIARGIRLGWLNKKIYTPVIDKAWTALKTEIDNDGTVHKICAGTMCSPDVNYYLNRPLFDNDTHGLFAVLFACIELSKLK